MLRDLDHDSADDREDDSEHRHPRQDSGTLILLAVVLLARDIAIETVLRHEVSRKKLKSRLRRRCRPAEVPFRVRGCTMTTGPGLTGSGCSRSVLALC